MITAGRGLADFVNRRPAATKPQSEDVLIQHPASLMLLQNNYLWFHGVW
jgi:hypothetical protein